MIEDGTAIGSALATAVNRLRALRRRKSKFVVLLTDGQSNAGTHHAADRGRGGHGARHQGLHGRRRHARPGAVSRRRDLFGNKVYRPMQVDIDEETLQRDRRDDRRPLLPRHRHRRACARSTPRSTRCEKTPFEAPQYLDYRELYPWLALPALLLPA